MRAYNSRDEIYSAVFDMACKIRQALIGFPEQLEISLSSIKTEEKSDKSSALQQLRNLWQKPFSREVLTSGVQVCEALIQECPDLPDIAAIVSQAKSDLSTMEVSLASTIADGYNPSLEELEQELGSINTDEDFSTFFLLWWKDQIQPKNLPAAVDASAVVAYAPEVKASDSSGQHGFAYTLDDSEDPALLSEENTMLKDEIGAIQQEALTDTKKVFTILNMELELLRQQASEVPVSALLKFISNFEEDFLTHTFIQRLEKVKNEVVVNKGKKISGRLYLFYCAFESVYFKLLDDSKAINEKLDTLIPSMSAIRDPELPKYEQFLCDDSQEVEVSLPVYHSVLSPPVPLPALRLELPAKSAVQTHLYLLNNGSAKFKATDVVAEIDRHKKRRDEFIFPFPGNEGHHQDRCNLSVRKGGGGLAEVSGDLYTMGVATLSLNTMLNQRLITEGMHINAMLDVVIGVLARYSLFSILRDTSTDEKFPVLLEIDGKKYGLSLYGGVNPNINYDIAKFYTNNYKLLLEFIEATNAKDQIKMKECLGKLNDNLGLEADLVVNAQRARTSARGFDKIFIAAHERYQQVMGITLDESLSDVSRLRALPASLVVDAESKSEGSKASGGLWRSPLSSFPRSFPSAEPIPKRNKNAATAAAAPELTAEDGPSFSPDTSESPAPLIEFEGVSGDESEGVVQRR